MCVRAQYNKTEIQIYQYWYDDDGSRAQFATIETSLAPILYIMQTPERVMDFDQKDYDHDDRIPNISLLEMIFGIS